VLALAGVLLAFGLNAHAQPSSSQNVHLVVPFPAGSNPDVVARILAPPLSVALKQTVLVENRPGAGGMIAGSFVANSTPDGNTLLVGSSGPVVIAPLMVPKPQWQWHEVFAPVASIGVTPVVVHVRPGLPIKSVKDLIDYAKKNPGKLTFADGGFGGINHLAGEMMKQAANVDLLRVQYTGIPRAIQDVLGGNIDVLFAQISTTLGLVQSGKLRALATMGAERLKALPEVPTLEEAGFKGLVAEGFVGLFAPIKTPPQVVSQLSATTMKVINDPKVAETLGKAAVSVRGLPSSQFTPYVQAETERWGRVITKGNLKAK
jgi:tripartite-type tricarboxylate transporter receptor subunit TctC